MTASEILTSSTPEGALRMLGSRWSKDGSATEKKNSSAGTGETEMLYATARLSRPYGVYDDVEI